MKRSVLVSGLAGVLLLGPAATAATAAPAPEALRAPEAPVFTACAQVYAAGFENVRVGAVVAGRLVTSRLDRDGDGFACDRRDDGSSGGSGSASGSGENSSEDSSGGEGGGETATGDGDGAGQVAVVPAGSAPTGDASTATDTSDVTTVLGWAGWSGAAVLAMLAAAVGVRQAGRERARRAPEPR